MRRDPKSLPIRAWLAWKSAGGLIDEPRHMPTDEAMLRSPARGARLMAEPPDKRLELENDRLAPENDRPLSEKDRPAPESDRLIPE